MIETAETFDIRFLEAMPPRQRTRSVGSNPPLLNHIFVPPQTHTQNALQCVSHLPRPLPDIEPTPPLVVRSGMGGTRSAARALTQEMHEGMRYPVAVPCYCWLYLSASEAERRRREFKIVRSVRSTAYGNWKYVRRQTEPTRRLAADAAMTMRRWIRSPGWIVAPKAAM